MMGLPYAYKRVPLYINCPLLMYNIAFLSQVSCRQFALVMCHLAEINTPSGKGCIYIEQEIATPSCACLAMTMPIKASSRGTKPCFVHSRDVVICRKYLLINKSFLPTVSYFCLQIIHAFYSIFHKIILMVNLSTRALLTINYRPGIIYAGTFILYI